jgi:hypothetical protein
MRNRHTTLTELGTMFGVSSHVIGRWLVEIGLRTPDKRPSAEAFEGGYCQQAPTGRGQGYFWVWHAQKTIAALEKAGHSRKESAPQAGRLVGPFTLEQSDTSEFRIVGTDGTVSVWVQGELKARQVLGLLNLGHDQGLLNQHEETSGVPEM